MERLITQQVLLHKSDHQQVINLVSNSTRSENSKETRASPDAFELTSVVTWAIDVKVDFWQIECWIVDIRGWELFIYSRRI